MLNKVKDLLIGSPLPTRALSERRLNKIRALAAFSPDALSSIAYANQEIYLGLVVTGAAGLAMSFPIALAITALLAIVALSYAQTIRGYPGGGGSYVVAKENLGTHLGLIAAAALMIDYTLTAAVSLTAGVAAIASAFPILWEYRVWLALALLGLITLLNLRGVQETGSFMAVPVYLFVLSYLPMLAVGLIQLLRDGPASLPAVAPPPVMGLTLPLVLHVFSAGCTALTGIEAISNGVPVFNPPEARNAQRTLGVMAVLMGLLFLGSIGLTQYLAVISGPHETILAALSRRVLGDGAAFYFMQLATLAILAVAANTSFAGFPRVAAILARDGFLPRQLGGLGDRLVFTNGILLLAGATAVLIIVFQGDTHALVPLFAIGAFLAFTLSQAGMVIHWVRLRQAHWLMHAALNGAGAMVTAAASVIIGYSKFLAGAWISILVIPILVFVFLKIRSHYRSVADQISLSGLPPSLRPFPRQRVVLPVSGVHRGIVDAVNFARSISDQVTAVYIEIEPDTAGPVVEKWKTWWPDVPLVVVTSPYRAIVEPLLHFLDEYDRAANDGQQAVLVLSEVIPARSWQGVLHNQTAALIKNALLFQRREHGFQRVIIDVPFHLKEQ